MFLWSWLQTWCKNIVKIHKGFSKVTLLHVFGLVTYLLLDHHKIHKGTRLGFSQRWHCYMFLGWLHTCCKITIKIHKGTRLGFSQRWHCYVFLWFWRKMPLWWKLFLCIISLFTEIHMTRDMRFPTMWHFDMCRLVPAPAASF